MNKLEGRCQRKLLEMFRRHKLDLLLCVEWRILFYPRYDSTAMNKKTSSHKPLYLLAFFIVLASTSCRTATDIPAEIADDVVAAIVLSNPSWDIQYRDSTANFIGLFAVDGQTVWASGTGGKYARTADGGASWTAGTVAGADSLAFRDVHAFDNQIAYVLSIGNADDSRIYRTNDGGESWELQFQNQDPNSFFDCFSFWDKDRGFAFSDSFEGQFRLIRTMDGGATWTDIPPEVVPDARPGEGAFASSGTCVVTRPGGLGWFSTGASGIDTRVIRTTDYGETWSESPTPIESASPTAGIFTLSFLDNERGIAMGGDYSAVDSLLLNTAVTTDGGATWTAAGMSNVMGSIYGASYVSGASSPTIVAVAPTGTDFSIDNGRTWTFFSTEDFWAVSSPSVSSPSASSTSDTFPGAAIAAQPAVWASGPGYIARLKNE